jgi:hypothetical protein
LTDTVAERIAAIASQGCVDGVNGVASSVDAIDANLKFGNGRKRTLSQNQYLAW